MITDIQYRDEENTLITVIYDDGHGNIYNSDYRNDEINQWLETHEISPWFDPVDYILKLRDTRNCIISTTDWTQLPDVPLSEELIEDWRVYRQALRDLPDIYQPTTKAEYEAIVWPTPPA